MKKHTKIALFIAFCTLSCPIKAGFARFAGRAAQAIMRGALVAIPATPTILWTRNFLLSDKAIQQEAQGIKLMTAASKNKTVEALTLDISKKIGVPVENISISPNPQSDHCQITKYKNEDNSDAVILNIGYDLVNRYSSDPETIAVLLAHEATHANYNHIAKRQLFGVGVFGAATSVGAYCATRKINPQTLPTLKLFTRSLSHSGKLIGLLCSSIVAFGQLEQYQERKADQAALNQTENINELKQFKSWLQSQESNHKQMASNSIMQAIVSHPTPESRIKKVDERIQGLL